LKDISHNLKRSETPFFRSHHIDSPIQLQIPFNAGSQIIEEIKAKGGYEIKSIS